MSIYDELGNRLEEALNRNSPRGRKARIGYTGSDGTYHTTVAGSPGKVWVRIGEYQREVAQAINLTGVAPEPDMPVLVGIPPGATELHVLGLDPDAVSSLSAITAGIAPWHTHEHGALYEVVSERRLRPGRVTPYLNPSTGAYGLDVYIEPHHHAGGYWPGGVVALASYVPAVAGTHRWVLVGVDEDTNTSFVVQGSAQARTIPLSQSQLASLVHPTGTGYCGVRLEYGVASLGDETLFSDRTRWRSEAAGGGGGGIAIYERWDPDAPPETAGERDDEFDDNQLAAQWTEWDYGSYVTASEVAHGLRLNSTSADTRLGGVYVAKPTGTNWSVWTKVNLRQVNIAACTAGIALLEDGAVSSGNVRFLSVETSASSFNLMDQSWAQWDTYSTTTVQRSINAGFGHVYLRIRHFGATGQTWFDYSLNGEGWLALASFTLWPSEFDHIALVISNYDTDGLSEAFFDFFRSYTTASFSDFPAGRLIGQGNGGVAEVSELNDLDDVDLSTPPTDGQALVYDSTLSAWHAEDQSGSTPTLDVDTITAIVEQALASGTLTSNSTIDLSSISGSYSALRLEITGAVPETSDTSATLTLNNDTTDSNYLNLNLRCQGDSNPTNSDVAYTRAYSRTLGRVSYNSTVPTRIHLTLYLPRYATSDQWKVCEYRLGGMGTNEYETLLLGTVIYNSSSAINRITVGPAWDYQSGTHYVLYGRTSQTLVTNVTLT